MNGESKVRSFRLARMCPLILTLTLILQALPPVFLVGAMFGSQPLAYVAVFLIALYAWVWLRFRPNRLIIHDDRIEVIWPLKRRNIPRGTISGVRVMDKQELKREIGWGMRIGAGGLCGAFGWLWTRRRGVIQMYVTRMDRFVWIDRADGRPWLVTPEDPDEFARVLALEPPRRSIQ